MMKPLKHILLIRLSALGDVAMTVPVILALNRMYPDVKITVLSKAFHQPLFNNLPNVTFCKVDTKGEHKGFLGIRRLFLELKELQIDAVADLHNVLRSQILGGFFKCINTPVYRLDKGRKEKAKLTQPIKTDFKPLLSGHQRYAYVFKHLGMPLNLIPQDICSPMTLDADVVLKLGKGHKKWLGIAPFAAHSGKMYPLDLLEEVIKELDGTYKIMLFGGGKSEVDQLDILASKYSSVMNVAKDFKFEKQLAVISRLDAMLSMDSGNGHLAAMFGVPVITIWGVTHPYLGFVPYNQPEENQITVDRNQFPLIPTSVYGNKIPQGYEQVMRTIKPELILARIKSVMN